MIKFIACIIFAVENLLLLLLSVVTASDTIDRSEAKAMVILGMFFGLAFIFALCGAFIGGLA